MHPKDADGMANSVDPDQTASSEAVRSWSALFAETYLSQNIEFVRYFANADEREIEKQSLQLDITKVVSLCKQQEFRKRLCRTYIDQNSRIYAWVVTQGGRKCYGQTNK